MHSWNRYIVCEETTGQIDQICSTLFDIQSIGTLHQGEQNDGINFSDGYKSTVLSALSDGKDLVIAVDSAITLYENSGSSQKSVVNLKHSVDALCFRPDGKQVIVGDNGGNVHIVDCADGSLIFTHDLLSKSLSQQSFFSSVFCINETNTGCYSFGVSMQNGKVCIFRNIELDMLSKGCKESNSELINKVKSSMSMEQFDTSRIHTGGICQIIGFNNGIKASYVTMGTGSCSVALWEEENCFELNNKDKYSITVVDQIYHDGLFEKPEDGFIQCIQCSGEDSRDFYMLDNHGCLWEGSICDSIVFRRVFDIKDIKDFAICESFSNEASRELYAIENGDGLSLGIYNLPSLEKIHSTNFQSIPIALFSSCSITIDELVFITAEATSFYEDIDQLSVRVISKALPEDRLSRLLHKNKFMKALEFAKQYNLETQQVYEQKARFLMQLINNVMEGEEQNYVHTKFQELIECLQLVEADVFVADICLNAVIPDLRLSYNLLIMGRTRLECYRTKQLNLGQEDEEALLLIEKLGQYLSRLVTYQLVYGSKCFKTNMTCLSEEDAWLHFRDACLPIHLFRLIATGNLNGAAQILTRHKAELISFLCFTDTQTDQSTSEIVPVNADLDVKDVCKKLRRIFATIPNNVEVLSLAAWLEDFLIPTLIVKIPFSETVIAAWLCDKTKNLEHSSKDWPCNALRLANTLFAVKNRLSGNGFMNGKFDFCNGGQTEHDDGEDKMQKLRLLVSRLKQLIRLQERYNCTVTLKDLAIESTMSLTYRMLDRVMVPELISQTLDNNVRPYMKEQMLDENEVLLGYVEDILMKYELYIEGIAERRVVEIIDALEEKTNVIRATAILVKKAIVPWSEHTNELVEKVILWYNNNKVSLSHDPVLRDVQKELEECMHTIKQSQQLSKLPEIKAEYGCQCEINESSPLNSSNSMEFVMFLVGHSDDSAFDQAVSFVRDFSTITILDVYKFKLVDLIEAGKLEACVALLDKAFAEGNEFGISLLNRAMSLCSTVLAVSNDFWKENRVKYCQATIHLICHCSYTDKYCKAILYETMLELKNSLAMFKNILCLQEKYGKFISVEQYMSEDYRDSCLKQLIEDTQCEPPTTPLSNGGQGDAVAVICSFSTTMFSNTLPQEKDHPAEEDLDAINIQDLFNYASLLGIASKTIHIEMVKSAAKSSSWTAGFKLCSDILTYSPGPETAAVVYKFIMSVLNQFFSCSNPVQVLGHLTELCAASLSYCFPRTLTDFINVYSLLSICCEIFNCTNLKPSSFLMGPATSDQLDSINWLNIFYDEKGGIQLNLEKTNILLKCLIPTLVKNKSFLQSKVKTDYQALQQLQSLADDAIATFRGCGRYMLAYNLIAYCGFVTVVHLSNGVGNPSTILKEMKSAQFECSQSLCKVAEELVIKVLNSKAADVDLAVGLLTSMSLEKATNLIKSNIDNNSRNYKRMMSYTTAGLNFLKLHQMEAEILKFQSYFVNVYWGFTLGNIDIDVKSILFSSASSKVNIVPVIMRHRNITGKIIKDFCTDYNLDINKALLDYAAVLLADVKFTIAEANSPMLMSNNENMQVAVNSPLTSQAFFLKSFCGKEAADEKEELEENEALGHRGRLWTVIKTELKFICENVYDVYELCDGLYDIALRKIHPYAYKRLECILDWIMQQNVQHLQEDVKKILKIVNLLKEFKRERNAGESEVQWFKERYGTMGSLPSLATTRLPIQPLINADSAAWKIFEAELSEDSIQYLLPVAKLLNFSIDKVYTAAAASITSFYLKSQNIRVSKGKILSIKHFVARISEKHLATAVAKGFAEMLSTSQEKVDAYKWCMELAADWLSASTNASDHVKAAQQTMGHFKRCLKNTSTELVLKKFLLDSSSFNHLIDIPQKLVVNLYKHESIVDRYHHPNKVYPDIHEAANQIADIHRGELDITKIRNLMMVEWLLSGEKNVDNNEDSTINLANQKVSLSNDGNDQVSNMMDSENIIRILYILSFDKDDITANTLIKVIQRDDNRITNAVKAKGLYCLLKMFPDYIQKISGQKIKDLKVRLQIMTFVSELEMIGCALTPEQFSSCVKAELAQSIVLSASHLSKIKAVRTAAEICRVFSSWCPNTWYVILQNLVATEQVVYLHQLLREISWNSVICSLPCLPTVWQSCVTQPLVKMTPPLNKGETKTCIACYNFLLECPVLLQIDLKTIAQHFCNIELSILAMGCLLCNPAEYEFALQVAKTHLVNLDQQLEQLDMNNHAIAGQTLIMDCIKSVTV